MMLVQFVFSVAGYMYVNNEEKQITENVSPFI